MAKNQFVSCTVFPGPKIGEVHRQTDTEEVDDATQARREYIKAFESYFPDEDLTKCVGHLRRANELKPDESLYRTTLSLVELKRGNFADAREQMEYALRREKTEYRRAFQNLYLGRIYDLLQERAKAVASYEKAQAHSCFYDLAIKGRKQPWTAKNNRRFVIDFTIGEGIEP